MFLFAYAKYYFATGMRNFLLNAPVLTHSPKQNHLVVKTLLAGGSDSRNSGKMYGLLCIDLVDHIPCSFWVHCESIAHAVPGLILFKLQPDFYGFLQASPPDLYIERFNVALGQYMGALQSIVPLFIYMVSSGKLFSNKVCSCTRFWLKAERSKMQL